MKREGKDYMSNTGQDHDRETPRKCLCKLVESHGLLTDTWTELGPLHMSNACEAWYVCEVPDGGTSIYP